MSPWNQYEVINKKIIPNLIKSGFTSPTEVQHLVLSQYRDNNHFIVASQTGSGKTLAFGIPIISEIKQHLAFYNEMREKKQISCLILTPTRELAMQINKHLNAIVDPKEIVIGTLIGGMSKDKQKRIINKVPHIFIATPGRLWDFIENEQNDVLNNLNKVKFLIVDEADRMVELGHFPDLDKIVVKLTTPTLVNHNSNEIREAMKDKHSQVYVNDKMEINFDADKPVELDYDEFLKIQKGEHVELDEEDLEDEDYNEGDELNEEQEGEEDEEEEEDQEAEEAEEAQEEVEEELVRDEIDPSYKPNLRTFLVSATLTQQFRTAGSKFKYFKKDGKSTEPETKESNKLQKQITNSVPKLQSLLGKLKVKAQPIIIDLTQILIFPKQLEFFKALVEEEDKLMLLYNYLEMHQGETFIIFMNSITYANKLASMLKVIGLKCVTLHSHQQQRQRLQKLDKFTQRIAPILVCTDVAARGLDIVNVENVIHYQIPFSTDTFVHRCGRTARINKGGRVLSMIGPKDMVRFSRLEADIIKNGLQVVNFKLSYQQVQNSRQMLREAQLLEKEGHQLIKKNKQKEQLQKKLQDDEFDVDPKEIKEELQDLEEEIIKKKQKLMNQKHSYKVTTSLKQRLEEKYSRRRNALFLQPDQVFKLQDQLKTFKERQIEQQERNKVREAMGNTKQKAKKAKLERKRK